MLKNIGLKFCSGLLIGGASQLAFAYEAPYPIHITISETLFQTDNANRATDKANAIDELQATTALNLNAFIENQDKINGDLTYRWAQTEYSEDSQLKRPTLTGSSNLSMGGTFDFYNILLSHTSNQILIDPTESDVLSNQENRNTLSAALKLTTKPTLPNQLSLTTAKTYIEYDEFESLNSERIRADINYQRSFTKLNSGGFNLSYTEVTYPDFAVSDFDSTLLYGYFQRQLRQLSYYFALGINQNRTLTNDDNSPFSRINISYTYSGNEISLMASTEMTDSSQGNSQSRATSFNQGTPSTAPPETGLATADGSLNIRDQIQRNSANLNYRNNNLCSLCSLSIEISYENDDFANTPTANSIDILSTIRAAYRLTPTTNLRFDIGHSSFELTNAPNASNFEQNTARITWAWQGRSGLNLSTFFQVLERNNEQLDSYSANSIGLALSYQII